MPDVEIYSYEACPFAQRTRMVLIEKGINFSLTEIDLGNKPEGWEKISPYGKVPLLRHDGGTLYESAIINEYLDEQFPDPPLMPTTPLARAQVRIWMDYCDNRYLKICYQFSIDRNDPDKQQENLQKLDEAFQFMEHEGLRKLGAGPYWLGSEPTLVDFQFMPFMERFPSYEELWGASIPDDCTRIHAWLAAMRERHSYKATAHPADYHLEKYRRRLKVA